MKPVVKTSVSLALLASSLIFASSVFAQGTSTDDAMHPKLGNGALRSCQARENAIKTRLTHLTQLVTRMETKFDSIATRVETHYTTKVLPSGKTVSNYNDLVSSISAKKTVVATDLTKAQTDVAGFSCSTDDPKSQLTTFRLDMQKVKGDLKDYRTAIKNLIVAVRSVTGEQNSATESAK